MQSRDIHLQSKTPVTYGILSFCQLCRGEPFDSDLESKVRINQLSCGFVPVMVGIILVDMPD